MPWRPIAARSTRAVRPHLRKTLEVERPQVGHAVRVGRSQPDVAGFTDRALPETTLRNDFSTTGYLYYPPGSYQALEVLLAEEDSGNVHREAVPIEHVQ